jgi:hypothetical protein
MMGALKKSFFAVCAAEALHERRDVTGTFAA